MKNSETNINIQEIEKRINNKITIFKHSDFGFPQSIKCVLNDVKIKDYAQYKNCIYLIFTPKGKRKQFQIIIKGYESILIYDEYIDLNTEMYTTKINENIKQSELCFSNNYFENAKKSTEQIPFLNIIKN